jgi:predicted SAM-dependent methyltransferase
VKLNAACGNNRWPGFENTDINPALGVPYLDLEDRPYRYKDNSAELVMISHGLHMTHDGTRPVHPNPQAIIREFHRILKPGGWLRIDDNPYRVYDDAHRHADEGVGYPEELRTSRADFVEMLRNIGFDPVVEVPPDETQIDTDDETRQAIVSNHVGHDSFAIEAQK